MLVRAKERGKKATETVRPKMEVWFFFPGGRVSAVSENKAGVDLCLWPVYVLRWFKLVFFLV